MANGTPSLESVVALLQQQSSYHHHKETMAHGAAALYVGGAAALLANPFWRGFGLLQPFFLLLAFVTAIGGLVYIAWQLWNRRTAAKRVAVLFENLRGNLPATASVAPAGDSSWVSWLAALGLPILWGIAAIIGVCLPIRCF